MITMSMYNIGVHLPYMMERLFQCEHEGNPLLFDETVDQILLMLNNKKATGDVDKYRRERDNNIDRMTLETMKMQKDALELKDWEQRVDALAQSSVERENGFSASYRAYMTLVRKYLTVLIRDSSGGK